MKIYIETPTSASQPTSSRGVSVKNKLFLDLLTIYNKSKTSHPSFNEIHYYIDRVRALTNKQKRYEDFDILS